ncbi:hypothetical protein G7Y89_g2823 [Cudoniella acicularis]|uniref:Rhodopsin domain-containing protein n=1 Tax=Cudoniella acicularis TaxID=354080 RepID=A0A8H4RUE3_9HELO|nr:hypothetical protein G7Y89_g2823 [Cudoniella acicularis]
MATLAPLDSFSPQFLSEYSGNTPFAICVSFIFLELAFVGARYYSRYLANVKWGMDDYIMIPATVLCLGQCGLCIAFIKAGGAGYHEATVRKNNPTQVVLFHKIQFSIAMSYFSAVLLPKLSILGIFLRVFVKKAYRIAAWTIGAFLTANWLGTTVAITQVCKPLSFFWDQTLPGGGTCFHITNFLRWSSFMNIVTDLAMLVLPLPAVWEIQTSKQMKVGLTITFMLGSLGLITAILRFHGFFSDDATVDAEWAASPLIVWTIIETGTYLIAACLPTFRPLAILIWKRNPLTWVTNTKVTAKDDSEIALNSRGRDTTTFKRLNNDLNEFGDLRQGYKWVSSSNDADGRGMVRDGNGILVHHRVEAISNAA